MEVLNIEGRSYLSSVSLVRNKRLSLKAFPQGFLSLFEQSSQDMNRSFGSYWMYCAGHSLSLCNRSVGEETDCLLLSNSSSGRKHMRRALTSYEHLFGGRDVNLGFESLGLRSDMSKDLDVLSSFQIKGEYYFPFAFTQDQQVISGAYLNIRQYGIEYSKAPRADIQSSPIKEFYTGGCFFGSTLYGVDQIGVHHSLTSPHNVMPEGTFIERLVVNPDLHPDEVLTRESLKNFIPLMKVMSQSDKPTLHYHLPVDNYIFYGLHWYFEGFLSEQALEEYIRVVRQRSDDQWRFLNSLADQYGVKIIRRNSLSDLNIDLIDSERFLSKFLSSLSLDKEVLKADLRTAKALTIKSLWQTLKHEESDNSIFWQIAYDKQDDPAIGTQPDCLLMFNYIDYSASLAASVAKHGDRQVAALLPIQESPVVHFYKKLFSEKIGALLSIQWLPPFLIHIPDFHDRAFYLSDYLDDVNELKLEDIVASCFKLSGECAVLNVGAIRQNYSALLRSIESYENGLFGSNIKALEEEH
jgi:hypothetical protein